jgi:malonate transporter and related proteins
MSSLLDTMILVFGLVALGYAFGRAGLLGSRTGDGLTDFAVTVAIPVLLFRTLVEADFSGARPWQLWGAYFSAVALCWVAGQFIVTRVFGRDSRAGIVGGVAASFSNLVLLGAPLVLGIYGQAGFEVLSLVVMVHLPIMMAASIVLFAWADRGSGDAVSPVLLARQFMRVFLGNPLIVGILAGIAWRLTGLPIPAPARPLVDALAGVAGPVALFAVGLGLVQFGIRGAILPALALSPLKLFAMPAIVLVFVMALGLPPLVAKVAVVSAAMPTGVNPYLIATRFGTGQALASNTMTLTTAVAARTTAFWLVIAEAAFG